MSMKHGILALLEDGPSHGYQLKTEFESRTGGAWMVNVGQVYSTLQRLERDGLVAPAGDADDERRVFRITDAGQRRPRAVVRRARGRRRHRPATSSPSRCCSPRRRRRRRHRVLQRQRTATLEQLQEYTRLKREADPDDDLPFVLLMDALVLKAEAEVRWLDTCEARLRRRATEDAR